MVEDWYGRNTDVGASESQMFRFRSVMLKTSFSKGVAKDANQATFQAHDATFQLKPFRFTNKNNTCFIMSGLMEPSSHDIP